MNIQVQGHGIYNHGFKLFFKPAVDVWGQSIQTLLFITLPPMKTPPRTSPCLGLPPPGWNDILLLPAQQLHTPPKYSLLDLLLS